MTCPWTSLCLLGKRMTGKLQLHKTYLHMNHSVHYVTCFGTCWVGAWTGRHCVIKEQRLWIFHKISRLEELLDKRGHFVTGEQSQEEHNKFPAVSSFSFPPGYVWLMVPSKTFSFFSLQRCRLRRSSSLLLTDADCLSLF